MLEYFGTSLGEHGHYRWRIISEEYMTKLGISFNDLPFDPERLTLGLSKGEVIFYQGGGYTVLGIAGSCKDTRPGTKSIFWVKEIISRSEMIGRLKKTPIALKIFKLMPFNIQF